MKRTTAEDVATTASQNVITLPAARRRYVSISGGKGGVGKSTLAVGLSAHYARQGARTVLVDGDFGMADLNLLLGLAPDRSVLEVMNGSLVDKCLVEAHGLHLLPGLNGSFSVANADEEMQQALLMALRQLTEAFDTVVIDTPAGIDVRNIEVTAAADEVIVVATPEPVSLADAYACLKILKKYANRDRVFLIPNAVKSETQANELTSQLTNLVDHFLDIDLVALPFVPHDPAVPIAASSGVPLTLARPDAPASRAIARLARALDGHAFLRPGPPATSPPEDTR